MNERDAFLEAVLASPDDDAPRLMFADWLDENGDPERAELIRVQCALAAAKVTDPRLPDLEARAEALLRKHGTRWRRELPHLRGVYWKDFNRGFVSEAHVQSPEVLERHAEAIFAAAPIEEIGFYFVDTREALRRLVASPLAARLRRLYVDEESPEVLEWVAESPYLTQLRDLKVFVDDEERVPGLLAGSPHFVALRKLEVWGKLSAAGVRRLASSSHLRGVRGLRLCYCEIGPEGARALAASRSFRDLHLLQFDGNRVGDEGLRALAGSTILRSVRELTVEHDRIGPDGAAALADSRYLGNLRRLRIVESRLGSEAARALFTSPNLGGLRELDLKYNRIGPAAARWLADAKLGSLERLDLSDNRVDGPSAEALLMTTGLPRLRSLNVNYNTVGSLRKSVLAEAPARKLDELELEDTELGDRGVCALAACPRLAGLTRLNLVANRVANRGALALATAPFAATLDELELNSNCIGAAGARALLASPIGRHSRVLSLGHNKFRGELMNKIKRRRVRKRPPEPGYDS